MIRKSSSFRLGKELNILSVFLSLNLTGERKKKEAAFMICELRLVVLLLLFDDINKI